MTNIEILENIEAHIEVSWDAADLHSPGEEFLLNVAVDLIRVCKDLQGQLDNVVRTV